MTLNDWALSYIKQCRGDNSDLIGSKNQCYQLYFLESKSWLVDYSLEQMPSVLPRNNRCRHRREDKGLYRISLCQLLSLIESFQLIVVACTCNPSTQKLRQENYEIEARLVFIECSRPV
jgi:hypothetical protein